MKSDLDTSQVTLPRTDVLVRICAEIAGLAVVTAVIGVWYILTYPSALILGQPIVGAANNATNSVRLTWTAPGDDGAVGQAASYDIRYSIVELTEATWSRAFVVANPPAPQPAGSPESFLVTNLSPATTYYFGLKTSDEAGNQAALSNIVSKRTSCIEAWTCTEWSSCQNNEQTRTCTDLNACGTTDAKPAEAQACQTGPSCNEDWSCTEWSACTDGRQTRTCTDRNQCGTTVNKPGEDEACGAGGGGFELQETYIVAAPNAGGGPQVRVLTSDGRLIKQFFAYDQKFRGGVNLAVGDLGSDGVDEIVVGPGAGREPLVRVFTLQGDLVTQFLAYDKAFRGGVHVAVGNVDGKGNREILTSPASLGGPEIRTFGFRGGKYSQLLKSVSAYSRRLRGGWVIAAADLNGDGTDEVITAPGANTASPHVKQFVYDGAKLVQRGKAVLALPSSFRGGVSLAAGDLDGDGDDEVLVSPEGNGAPQLRVLARRGNGSFGVLSNGYLVFHPSFRGGVSLAAGDVDDNEKADVVAAVRSGDRSLVRIFRADGKRILSEFLAFPQALTTGISIATGRFFPAQ